MNDFYHGLMAILNEWSGLGPTLRHRLLDQFLQPPGQSQLKKFLELINTHPLCQVCGMPGGKQQCQCPLPASPRVFIFPSLVDYLFVQDLLPKDCSVLALKGYLAPGYGRDITTTGLQNAAQAINTLAPTQIILCFNQTLEALATLNWLKKNLQKHTVQLVPVQYHLHIYGLSSPEREEYVKKILSAGDLN